MLNPESVILNLVLNLIQYWFRIFRAGLFQHLTESIGYETLKRVQGDKEAASSNASHNTGIAIYSPVTYNPVMKKRLAKARLLVLSGITMVLFMVLTVTPAGAAVKAGFLYKLADFTGFIPYTTPRVVLDETYDEVYVLFQNTIRVFNQYGMEIYRFGDDLQVGRIHDLAVRPDGNIILLCYEEGKYRLVLCNYRGEQISEMSLRNLHEGFSGFSPVRFLYRNGNLYFASLPGFQVVVTDEEGNYKDGYDLAEIMEFTRKELEDKGMVGFNVTKDGSILFTVPSLFKVYRISPDRKATFFGRPGGPPGMFGVIAGVAADKMDNYLVADKLKSIVQIFDRNTQFISEFGYRTGAPGGLFSPDEVWVSSKDRVFVSQSRGMGISVFLLTYD